MNKQLLTIIYASKQRSIDLMDQFEQRDEGMEPLYKLLLLKNVCSVLMAGCRCDVDFLISRKPYEMPWDEDGITFTTLRKRIGRRTFTLEETDAINPVSQLLMQLHRHPETREILLAPVILKAQNSWNRSGYGPNFRGRHLYGETSLYLIQKLFLHERNKKQELRKR